MIASLLAAVVFSSAPQTVVLTPTDDIWVHPKSGDPAKETIMECWGAEGMAVAPDPAEGDEFSYCYLKFDLAKLPKTFKLKEAKLSVWHVENPKWELSFSKESPLQARGVAPDFAERNWEFDISMSIFPDKEKEAFFGSMSPSKIEPGKATKFEIDLLSGPGSFAKFAKTYADKGDRKLGLALTSTINPIESGQNVIYKFYTKECKEPAHRPSLKLSFE